MARKMQGGTEGSTEPFSFDVKDSDFRRPSTCRKVKHVWICVKVAKKERGVAVRDSKDPSKATLFFTKDEWAAFTQGVKNGEFDV